MSPHLHINHICGDYMPDSCIKDHYSKIRPWCPAQEYTFGVSLTKTTGYVSNRNHIWGKKKKKSKSHCTGLKACIQECKLVFSEAGDPPGLCFCISRFLKGLVQPWRSQPIWVCTARLIKDVWRCSMAIRNNYFFDFSAKDACDLEPISWLIAHSFGLTVCRLCILMTSVQFQGWQTFLPCL